MSIDQSPSIAENAIPTKLPASSLKRKCILLCLKTNYWEWTSLQLTNWMIIIIFVVQQKLLHVDSLNISPTKEKVLPRANLFDNSKLSESSKQLLMTPLAKEKTISQTPTNA